MTLNAAFPANYTIEPIDLPSSGVDYEIGPTSSNHMTPYQITVDEASSYTLGVYSNEPIYSVITEVIATPDPWSLCIIERGTPYIGDVRQPQSFAEIVDAHNDVVAVKAIVSHEILLFVMLLDMLALDTSGVRWNTERIALNGISIERTTGDWVNCRPQSTIECGTFDVNLLTGEIRRDKDNQSTTQML
ncbi:MAG: hypothetical protein Q4A82_06610 [Corynebacterium sp.]|nr:hypothetical protein [Corynebacterium sp.]